MKLVCTSFSAGWLLLPAMAFSQARPGDVAVNIPFAFVAGERTLPPGQYVVSRINDNLSIHDRDNHGVYVATHGAQRPASDNTTKIVFHRYGDTYFLAEVWVAGDPAGRKLIPSRAERETERGTKGTEIAILQTSH